MAFDPIWFAWPICHALSLWYKNKQSSYSFRVHWHGKHIDKKRVKETFALYGTEDTHGPVSWVFAGFKTVYGQIWLNILVHGDKKMYIGPQ